MPELTCTLCGRVDEVPKWHPDVARHAGHGGGYVCSACQDRVRAEAIRQQDANGPPGGSR